MAGRSSSGEWPRAVPHGSAVRPDPLGDSDAQATGADEAVDRLEVARGRTEDATPAERERAWTMATIEGTLRRRHNVFVRADLALVAGRAWSADGQLTGRGGSYSLPGRHPAAGSSRREPSHGPGDVERATSTTPSSSAAGIDVDTVARSGRWSRRRSTVSQDVGLLRSRRRSMRRRVHQWLKKAVLLRSASRTWLRWRAAQGGGWWDKVDSKFGGWTDHDWRAAGFRAVPASVVRRSA